MAEVKEARVPDIGGYDDVPVIELLVSVGEQIGRDQGLITLESDKATMEVPSPLAGKLVERNRLGIRQGMAERQPEPVGRNEERFNMHRRPVADRGGQHHRHVEFSADQKVLQVVAIVLDRRKLHLRPGAAEPREDVRQHVARHQRGHTERQPARHLACVLLKRHPCVGDIAEDLRRMAQEERALVREVEPARAPIEQRHAEIGLQRLDRLRHRRLRDRQRPRRARHASRLGSGDEELKLAQCEGHGPLFVLFVRARAHGSIGALVLPQGMGWQIVNVL